MGRLTANAYKPLLYRRQTQILINFSDGKLYVNGAKTDRQCLAVIQVKKVTDRNAQIVTKSGIIKT